MAVRLRTRDITSEVAGWQHKSEEVQDLMARFYTLQDVDYELGNGIIQIMNSEGNMGAAWAYTSDFGKRTWCPVPYDKWGTGKNDDRDATAMIEALNWYYRLYLLDD